MPKKWETIIWSNDNQVYWRTYASLVLDELIKHNIAAPKYM